MQISNGPSKGLEEATYHQHNKVELLSHLCSPAKKATKNLLTFGKLTTTDIVGAIKRHDTVDNEKTVFIGGEVLGKAFQLLSLHLVRVSTCDQYNLRLETYFAVLGTSVDDVLASLIGID